MSRDPTATQKYKVVCERVIEKCPRFTNRGDGCVVRTTGHALNISQRRASMQESHRGGGLIRSAGDPIEA